MRKAALSRIAVTGALAVSMTIGMTACSAESLVDDIVSGTVEEGKRAVSENVESLLEDIAGGAGISSDGELPAGFPAAAVPLEGTVLGGGSGPNSSGWVVNVALPSVDSFDAASTALTNAGYTAAGVTSDSTSAFGTFTNADYRVVVTVSTDAGTGDVTANYVVIPA